MHLYEDTGRLVYAWNAVDVEMKGGLQHGHVIGLDENDNAPPRLLVDFGCPTQPAVLVPYGKIWECSSRRFTVLNKGTAVEALLHDGPHWKWYPGKLLKPRFDDLEEMVLVEVLVDGQQRRELLPWLQVRGACAEAGRPGQIEAGHFVLQTCSVPDGYWILERSVAAWLLREVERMHQLRFVQVLSQTMLYLRCRRDMTWGGENMVAIEFERNRNFYNEPLKNAGTSADAEPKRKTPVSVGEKHLALPLEVLKEIFLSLDTVDRVRCRRTCQLWTRLLTADDVGSEVRVALPEDRVRDVYALYACIAKSITPATRTISLRESGMYREEVFDVAQNLLNDAGIRIHRFIVHRRSSSLEESAVTLPALSSEMTAGWTELLPYCQRLIVKDFALTVLEDELTVMEFRLPLIVFTRGQVDEADVVDLFEKHLHHEGPPVDVQRIAQCMASGMVSKERARAVRKILQAYQASDPRPSAHYQEHRWSLYNMASVDVGQLNHFCLCALSRYVNDWRHDDDLSSDSSDNESDESDYW
ncbi:uncharacterized protein LOC129600925 [Paramacrobiotus metropolitanus]|uniref:uncharacterized protein LOC129600925 n=1 Tax=Paramacrobiotus metropolitanus TaxID=2943436 RepID=UPI002445CAB0|nr:uncharacterized protein LOC129600925 [Paramacrobiotus metropolitanus]